MTNPPSPRVLRGTALFLRAAAVKTIAEHVPAPLKTQLVQSANQTIDALVDEYCGTPSPPKVHNPWGAPSPVALELAALLAVYANSRVQAGELRTELLAIAGKLVVKAFGTA